MTKPLFSLLSILAVAALLRFYQLGQIPTGFFNDEAAVGYNAYSLLQTGKDEFGRAWPFFFESFGEGKLPLYVYQALPSVAIWGLTEFAVRFPMALLGTLTIGVLYLLVVEFGYLERTTSWVFRCKISMGLGSALMLAIMPWHIHFSRGVFGQESLFWVVLGTWGFIRWVRVQRLGWLGLALTAWLASILTYHASRVFLPLWIGYLLIYYSQRMPRKSWLIGLILVVLGGPWAFITFSPLGGARAGGVSVLHETSGVYGKISQDLVESKDQPIWLARLWHNKVEGVSLDIISRYTAHFNPQFLFFTGDPVRPRYRVPNVGQLLWMFLPFTIGGLYQLARSKQWPWLVWLLFSPLAAAVTFETPSTVRAIYMTVPLAIATGFGLTWVYARLPLALPSNWGRFRFITFWCVMIVAVTYSLGYYLDAYYVHQPLRQPYYWQDGYKELVQAVTQLQDQYDRVEVTDKRGTPYIFFLFYNQYDPARWQAQVHRPGVIEPAKAFNFIAIRQLDNLYFVADTCSARGGMQAGVLYVCTEEDLPTEAKVLKHIDYADGQPVFYLLEKEDQFN